MQVAASPCWVMDLPDVISACLSLDAWTRIPPACQSACARFFLQQHRPSPPRTWVGVPECSTQQLHSGPVFRDGSHSLMFRPPSLLATQIAPTVVVLSPRGSRGVYSRAERMSSPSRASGMLAARIDQLAAGDFHPTRLAALSAAPPRLLRRPLDTCRGQTPRPGPPRLALISSRRFCLQPS